MAVDEWNDKNKVDNHPVVSVSWYDARLYCYWLTDQLRQKNDIELPDGWAESLQNQWQITLLTESQWERAARGVGGRQWPWGDKDIDRNKANYDKTGIGGTSPVGCFPAGNTPEPEMITDLAGNVWEWCEDRYESEGDERVLRGGSWFNSAGVARSTGRFRGGPDFRGRLGLYGFRLAFRRSTQTEYTGARAQRAVRNGAQQQRHAYDQGLPHLC